MDGDYLTDKSVAHPRTCTNHLSMWYITMIKIQIGTYNIY